ncbi:MAG TPA: helix-turn-helix transcriptional regulator [Herpetosiphonaceae bacterium]
MERVIFGRLVQELRREHRDEHGRVWTQEFLSHKTGLPKRTIERIEEGSLKHIDANILTCLADALELTSMERKEFFFAAMGMNSQRLTSFKSDHLHIFDTLAQRIAAINLPAFVNDVFGDVVLVNMALLRLLAVPDAASKQDENPLTKDNINSSVFSPESTFRPLLGDQWVKIAHLNMQFFRGISLRYRLHSHFQQLLPELLRYPAFKRYWEQAPLEENDLSPDSIPYVYEHPTFGPLAYLANISVSATRMGELYTTVYLPMDHVTRQVFDGIVAQYGNQVMRCAPWPKDEMDERSVAS